jgi:hypothetical protein
MLVVNRWRGYCCLGGERNGSVHSDDRPLRAAAAPPKGRAPLRPNFENYLVFKDPERPMNYGRSYCPTAVATPGRYRSRYWTLSGR